MSHNSIKYGQLRFYFILNWESTLNPYDFMLFEFYLSKSIYYYSYIIKNALIKNSNQNILIKLYKNKNYNYINNNNKKKR